VLDPGGRPLCWRLWAPPAGRPCLPTRSASTATDLVRQTLDAAIDSGIEVMIGTSDGREIGQDEPETYDRVLVERAMHRAGCPASKARSTMAPNAR